MPNCFQLTRRADPASGPVRLQTIDDEMRQHFGAPPDPLRWYWHWYEIVGLALACGKTFAEIRAVYQEYVETAADPFDLRMVEVIDWLQANFTSDAFVQVGKR